MENFLGLSSSPSMRTCINGRIRRFKSWTHHPVFLVPSQMCKLQLTWALMWPISPQMLLLQCTWLPKRISDFNSLMVRPLRYFPGEVFQACPARKRPWGRPKTYWRDHISLLTWEHLSILPPEPEEVVRWNRPGLHCSGYGLMTRTWISRG